MARIGRVLSAYRKPLALALIHWFLSTVFQVDRLYFSYSSTTKYMVIVKGLYLLFLIAAWCFGFHAYGRIRERDAAYVRGAQVFAVHGVVMMLLTLFLWPGTWIWDDLSTLFAIEGYTTFHPWQHIITSIYQCVLLQVLPFPGGIILLQQLIISVTTAFIVVQIERTFNIKRLRLALPDILLKLIPFLLPPVLMYQFSGYRIGLYIYLELAMLVMLLSASSSDAPWTWGRCLLFCFLAVVASTWRTESLVYIPFICLCLILRRKKLLNVRCVTCLVLIVAGFLGMNRWQSAEQGNNDYLLISLLRPGAVLVRAADPETDADELEAIDKVMDVQIILDNPGMHGEALYWNTPVLRNSNGDAEDDYTDAEYSEFMKAFIKLSLKHPGPVFDERWNIFVATSNIDGRATMNVCDSAFLFESWNTNQIAKNAFARGWYAFSPVFKEARVSLINLLKGCAPDSGPGPEANRIIWNSAVPILILTLGWICLAVRRKWYAFIVASAVVLKIPVVILTEPSRMFMYLLSFYFLGYVCLTFAIWMLVGRKGKVDNDEENTAVHTDVQLPASDPAGARSIDG